MPMIVSPKPSPGRFLCCMPFVAVVSLWILICISTSEGLLQDQYIGCFYDKSQATEHVTAANSTDNALTIEKCIAKCQALQTTYAALQNGSVCHCRHDYGVQLGLPDSSCYLPCSGNKYEICGGFIGQQIAYSLYTVCPIGTYGAACDKGCHCKRDIPCKRLTGDCPGGCYGNWSGPACNITSVSHQYIGCYKDNSSANDVFRALELCIYCGSKDKDNINTIQSCSTLCAGRNFSYSGLQYSWECFCGDNYDRHGPSTGCNMSCSGDSKTICGGGGANSMYSVCPNGNYGKSCAGRCHCNNGERCFYRNGSCPSSQCKEGWTGTSCNIRECNERNGDCYISETCSVINLTYSTVSVCRCPNGFQRTNIRGDCTDTDECSMNVCDNETMKCINTIGSYRCSCKSGFQAHNATACIDIDECQQNICDNSTTDCSNTPGSYNCSCKEVLWSFNGHKCIGDEEHFGVIGTAVGSLFAVVVVATMAFAFLLFYRRRNGFCQSNPNESSKSKTTAKDLTVNPLQVNDKQRESYYIDCSPVTVTELSKVIQHKLTAPGVLDKEFKRVPMETKDLSTVGKNRFLKKKNRFQNIVPYDKNRVVLSQVGGVALSDYINASVIKGYGDTYKLIATQGPVSETICDFWRMICEKDVNVIVMITDLMENNKAKCAKYWPDIGKPLTCNGIAINTTSEHLWNGYTSRQFKVTKDSKSWEVTHWHFHSYPDHGVPEDVAKFMTFLKKACSSKLPHKCTVVHCSAGAGRTGTFIAIDYLMQQGKAGGDVDILGCLQHLRNQRPQMIQNLAQYEFVHTALLFEYTVGDTTILCEKFAAKFRELQTRDPNTGISKLEAQLQSHEDKKDKRSKGDKSLVLSKSINKRKTAELKIAMIQGWKEKDAYMTLAFPPSAAIDDFYSLTKEFNCGAVVFLDGELGTVESLFPTKQTPIVLRSSTVHCDSSTKEVYGACYKISQMKVSDDTYANVSVYANSGEVSVRSQMTVLHVTSFADTEFLECSVLNSIYNCIKKLNADKTHRPVVVISRAGDSLSAFCLAALIAFDMIRDVKEVDIFQIVQGIQKSRPQFSFSLPSYKALYSVVGKYIESGFAAESIGQEPLYEVTM